MWWKPRGTTKGKDLSSTRFQRKRFVQTESTRAPVPRSYLYSMSWTILKYSKGNLRKNLSKWGWKKSILILLIGPFVCACMQPGMGEDKEKAGCWNERYPRLPLMTFHLSSEMCFRPGRLLVGSESGPHWLKRPKPHSETIVHTENETTLHEVNNLPAEMWWKLADQADCLFPARQKTIPEQQSRKNNPTRC